MERILAPIRSLFRRAPQVDEQAAPRLVVSVPARLLTGISDGSAETTRSAHTRPKLVANTLNVSASGLAVLVQSLDLGSSLIAEGGALKIALELHPLGTVGMDGTVVRVEHVKEGEHAAYLLGVRITGMSHEDRALYLQYLGTKGWERVSAGGDGV